VLNALVSFVWPFPMVPTALISGQSVCWGCGSESISCVLPLLFTKLTLWPTDIVTVFGLTPLGPIVIVAPLGPGPPPGPVGGVPPPPLLSPSLPHATINTSPAASAAERHLWKFLWVTFEASGIRRIFSRC
jgi:hypothetical protein